MARDIKVGDRVRVVYIEGIDRANIPTLAIGDIYDVVSYIAGDYTLAIFTPNYSVGRYWLKVDQVELVEDNNFSFDVL